MKNISSTDILIDKITKAISYQYKNDSTSPGLTISYLKNKKFYCSIIKYTGAFGKGKEVCCSATNASLNEALRTLASDFLNVKRENNPIQELNDVILDLSKKENESTEEDEDSHECKCNDCDNCYYLDSMFEDFSN